MNKLSLDQQIRGICDLAQEISDRMRDLAPSERDQVYTALQEVEERFHNLYSAAEPNGADNRCIQTDQIRRSNARLNAILDDFKDGFLTLDREWRITYINHRAAQNGNQKPEAVLGRCIWEIYPQLSGTALEQHYRQAMEQRSSENFEMKGVIRDQWYRVSVHPTEEGISVYWLDISEQKQIEAERERLQVEYQRLQDEKFRTVFDALTNVVVIFDADGRPTRANAAAQAAYGFDVTAMERQESSQRINLCAPDGKRIALPDLPVSRALRGEFVHNEPLLLTDAQGRERTVLASASPICCEDGEICGVCLVWNDITDVETAERNVQASQDQVEFHHRLIEYQERKVDQIAQELHDGPVQNLLGVLFGLQAMIHDLQNDLPVNVEAQVESLRNYKMVIQRQVDHLYSFSKRLHPPVISKFGLQEAIRSHLQVWQERYPCIQVVLETQPGPDDLPEQTRMSLFRIYEEALTNIARHSQATQVHIRLHKTAWAFELSIQDNGLGFTAPDDLLYLPREGKFGLAGMQERAESIGSRIDMITHPGEGAFLRVVVQKEK